MVPIHRKKPPIGDAKAHAGAPLLDCVDWGYRILYGAESQRLVAVFEAKSTRAVDALSPLLQASLTGGEVARESKEASEAIIAGNPADSRILGLVPELAKRLSDKRALWVFAAIAEANPRADECVNAVPALVRSLGTMDDEEQLRDVIFCLGRIGGPKATDAVRRFVQSGRAVEGSDLWNTAMAAMRRLDPQ